MRRLWYAVAATAAFALSGLIPGVAGASTTVPNGVSYVAYCATASATSFQGCYLDGDSTPANIPAGSKITTDPVVPPTGMATTGLTAPDGILGVIPSWQVNPRLHIPRDATTFLYIDKQVNYFIPGTLVGNLSLPITTPANIPVTGDYSSFGAGTYYVASNGDAASGPAAITCTGATNTPTDELTGCTSSATDSIAKGSDVGAPGSCITPGTVLQTTGEGSLKGKTLFKNNEDYAAVRMAYTTNGLTFHDVTSAAGIQGLGSSTAQTGIRWVSPGGTVVQNPDGSLGLFFSEGQCSDGDSDAFGSMEYATSADGGLTWQHVQQIPDGDHAFGTGVLSTDYTYGASVYQAQHPGTALDVSAYYEGRVYSPSVVPHYSHHGWHRAQLTSLTMTFAGYRTSKPLPATTGSGVLPLGRSCETCTTPAATPYIPQPTDPALYRNILTVQLTPKRGTGTNPWSNPTTYVAGTPVVAQVQKGPWTTAQGDPGASGTTGPYGPNGDIAAGGGAGLYTTFTTGGSPTNIFGATVYPNLSTYPGGGATGTAIPYTTAYAGTPGPLAGYCGTGGYASFGPSTVPSREPAGFEPMSPYYFPHIESNRDGRGLIGFFDYRPKDSDEAVVVATSNDNGAQWTVKTEALELSQGHCPEGNSDVAQQTTTDDGEGHAFDLTVDVNGRPEWILYTLNRSNGTLDTLGSEFLAHVLVPHSPTLGLPSSEPVGTGSTTTTTGTNTVTNVTGGVSTSNLTVANTAAFQEIPGRIYITVPPS
jgi:hypothetical protein